MTAVFQLSVYTSFLAFTALGVVFFIRTSGFVRACEASKT